MADTHETSADIIAEMRLGATGDMPFAYRIGRPDRIVEYKTEDGKKYVQRSTVIESVTIDELADRLEAAYRREFGDCAKLREALENLYDQICHGETEQHVAANRQMIRAALAAPPRNCDRFATADEAFHAWNNTVDTPGGGTYVGLMDWLYAPATEQEGGKDAD